MLLCSSNGRRDPTFGRRRGKEHGVLAPGSETLRQKDCRKQNLWRDLYEVTEGAARG